MDFPNVFSLIIVCILFTLIPMSIEQNANGFTAELIHRDSPESPFYVENETDEERLLNTVTRSLNRIHRLNTGTSVVSSLSPERIAADVVYKDYSYLIKLFIGTPPFQVLAAIDTGSSLTWLQCEACIECYPQLDKKLDATNSSTYKELRCHDDSCKIMGGEACDDDYDGDEFNFEVCSYITAYLDNSISRGVIGSDLLTLKSPSNAPFTLPGFIFGCGMVNKGIYSKYMGGLVGLGYQPGSLISQLGHLMQKTFSYCLVPHIQVPPNTGKIHFGSDGIVSGKWVLTTPMLKKHKGEHYVIELEAITVGYERFEFDEDNGNETSIVVDSGTFLTFVPPDIYKAMEASVKMQMSDEKTCQHPILSLCYDREQVSSFPDVTMHYSGVDVRLNPYNAFVFFPDCMCFGFRPQSADEISILGSLAQANFLVGFDLVKETVSFKPAICKY